MFYLFGSLLFAAAMMTAFAVMIANFSQYRHAMMSALRSLSLDGWQSTQPKLASTDTVKRPSRMALRIPQAAA